MYIGTFLQDPDFIRSLYILAFALFIVDLRLMNHPRTAVRGPRSMCRPTMKRLNATM